MALRLGGVLASPTTKRTTITGFPEKRLQICLVSLIADSLALVQFIFFMDVIPQSRQYADFITVTCLEWTPLFEEDRFKDIVVNSLSFLREKKRVTVYSFVIMCNHFHLIWQMLGNHKREAVQRDFLKYTAQQILKILLEEKSPFLDKLLVRAKDRKYQIWERNSLSIPLWSGSNSSEA